MSIPVATVARRWESCSQLCELNSHRLATVATGGSLYSHCLVTSIHLNRNQPLRQPAQRQAVSQVATFYRSKRLFAPPQIHRQLMPSASRGLIVEAKLWGQASSLSTASSLSMAFGFNHFATWKVATTLLNSTIWICQVSG
jgi:hypothetical protein